jgi:hypothetical protein
MSVAAVQAEGEGVNEQKTWFRVWLGKIEPIQATRVSKAFITEAGRYRREKIDGWRHYFDTWEQAHEFLVGEKASEVKKAKAALDRAEAEYGRVLAMTEAQ